MLSKETREDIFKEFFGCKKVNLLMNFIDHEQYGFARIIVEDELKEMYDGLVRELSNFTLELHNRDVERILRLREIDTIITDKIMITLDNKDDEVKHQAIESE